jgi:hypothetical protein
MMVRPSSPTMALASSPRLSSSGETPSAMTTWNGCALFAGEFPGAQRDRLLNSFSNTPASQSNPGTISRAAPAASVSVGWPLCGSHLIQSQVPTR